MSLPVTKEELDKQLENERNITRDINIEKYEIHIKKYAYLYIRGIDENGDPLTSEQSQEMKEKYTKELKNLGSALGHIKSLLSGEDPKSKELKEIYDECIKSIGEGLNKSTVEIHGEGGRIESAYEQYKDTGKKIEETIYDENQNVIGTVRFKDEETEEDLSKPKRSL